MFPYQIKSLQDYEEQYKLSIEQPEQFWEGIAHHFIWHKKWNTILEWEFQTPTIKWFDGATLNITENCLDRHLETNANGIALIWEPNDPQHPSKTFTYQELYNKVNQCCHSLQQLGVQKGDRMALYLPMIPELTIAMLACARLGAIHTVIFGGFSAQAIQDRLEDAQCQWIITSDGATRGAKPIPMKETIDQALINNTSVKKVLVVKHTNTPITLQPERDLWWHESVELAPQTHVTPTSVAAEDPLFILYTSGSTGKPKGVVHTCAGYMIWAAYTFVNVFQYQKKQIHFCTADLGWITGHTYSLYGPLLAGGTSLIFEGIPTHPNAGRLWDICDKHQVNSLYTAPTAIRSLMSFGEEPLKNKSLKSLKVLGSVGEPINEEAWHWYSEKIGKNNCPLVDTWWQTETGGIMISALAGITPLKPTYATRPLPGVHPILVDDKGTRITEPNTSGNLCITQPWPGMSRTTYNDHQRFKQSYFSIYPNLYFTGDGCLKDEQGNYRITGRVDDVLNVSGHRIGTAELEDAIDSHEAVIECAIVGYPHDIKGQGIYAFVVLNTSVDNLEAELHQSITNTIGAIAKPDKIQAVQTLPKTRSGKIMRRILRKIAEGDYDNLGDTSTLLDPNCVSEIIKNRK